MVFKNEQRRIAWFHKNINFDEIKGATLHDIYPNIPNMMKNPWKFQ